jgi:hypothetical protein
VRILAKGLVISFSIIFSAFFMARIGVLLCGEFFLKEGGILQ